MKHLIMRVCLIAALCGYALGMSTGLVTSTLIAMLAEGAFWIRRPGHALHAAQARVVEPTLSRQTIPAAR